MTASAKPLVSKSHLGIAAVVLFLVPMVAFAIPVSSPNLRMNLAFWFPPVVASLLALVWRPAGGGPANRIAMAKGLLLTGIALLPSIIVAPAGYALGLVSLSYGNHLALFNRIGLLSLILIPMAIALVGFGYGFLLYRVFHRGMYQRIGEWAEATTLLPGIIWFAAFLVTPFRFGEWGTLIGYGVWLLALERSCFLIHRHTNGLLWPGLLRSLAIYFNVYILAESTIDVYSATMYSTSSESFRRLMVWAPIGGLIILAGLIGHFERRTHVENP